MKTHYAFSVQSFETDLHRQIKPHALQSRIQELAYLGSEAGGSGYAELRRKGLFWALNRMHIHVDEWPLWGDDLEMISWACGRTGPLNQRNFVLHRASDPEGEPLVKATSSWTVLHVDGRGISRERVYPEGFDEMEEVLPFCTKTVPPSDVEMAPAGSRLSQYSELDSNGHVNNCCYVQWATDLLGVRYLSSRRLTDIQVSYYREIHPDEQVDFLLGHSPDATATDCVWWVEGRVGGERSFCIRLEFH